MKAQAGTNPISLTREDLTAALFGLGVAKQEIIGREARFQAMLESMVVDLSSLKVKARKPWGSNRQEKVISNEENPIRTDGSYTYATNKDGTIRRRKDGTPWKNPLWTPERRREKANLMRRRVKTLGQENVFRPRQRRGLLTRAKAG